MQDVDKHLEKLLFAQQMLFPALRRAEEQLSQMNQNERKTILEKFAKCSQWTAPLEEQLAWTRINQSEIIHLGNSVEVLGEICDE